MRGGKRRLYRVAVYGGDLTPFYTIDTDVVATPEASPAALVLGVDRNLQHWMRGRDLQALTYTYARTRDEALARAISGEGDTATWRRGDRQVPTTDEREAQTYWAKLVASDREENEAISG